MYKNLRELRESLGMTQKEFAASLNIGLTTYNGYEVGTRDPKSDFWVKVAMKYQVTIDYLMGYSNDPHSTGEEAKNAPAVSAEAMTVAKKYDAAPPMIQGAVRAVLDSYKSNIVELPKPMKRVPYLYGVAAGVADAVSDLFFEDYETDNEKAEFAIHINGNSMEPYLHDGDVALGVKRWPKDGEVGAFYLDGGFLVKQVVVDSEGNVHLFSLNRARSDADDTIWHDSGRDLRCIGTILVDGKLPPLPD